MSGRGGLKRPDSKDDGKRRRRIPVGLEGTCADLGDGRRRDLRVCALGRLVTTVCAMTFAVVVRLIH